MATFKEIKENAVNSKKLKEHAFTLEPGPLRDLFLTHSELLFKNKRQEHLAQITPEISEFLGYDA